MSGSIGTAPVAPRPQIPDAAQLTRAVLGTATEVATEQSVKMLKANWSMQSGTGQQVIRPSEITELLDTYA